MYPSHRSLWYMWWPKYSNRCLHLLTIKTSKMSKNHPSTGSAAQRKTVNLCRNQNFFLTFENMAAALLLLFLTFTPEHCADVTAIWRNSNYLTNPFGLDFFLFYLKDLRNVLLSLSLINHHHTLKAKPKKLTGRENKPSHSPRIQGICHTNIHLCMRWYKTCTKNVGNIKKNSLQSKQLAPTHFKLCL